MTMRHLYIYTAIDGSSTFHFPHPPRVVRESFRTGDGVTPSVTKFTPQGDILTAWTTALICDDYVWVKITHRYSSDEPMFANDCVTRLARMVALEVEAAEPTVEPDAMTAITGSGHI